MLWRQWERLYLVRGLLHRLFHELEGQGWRHQLVVPEDRSQIILQPLHGGSIGAHLGTACTLALAEQGFYWPGMRANVSRICTECDCAMLKRRRGLTRVSRVSWSRLYIVPTCPFVAPHGIRTGGERAQRVRR